MWEVKLSIPNVIYTKCDHCQDKNANYGSKHSVKLIDSKIVLRCQLCNGGWVVAVRDLPVEAPRELLIQAINNLIVNRLADILPPDT